MYSIGKKIVVASNRYLCVENIDLSAYQSGLPMIYLLYFISSLTQELPEYRPRVLQ